LSVKPTAGFIVVRPWVMQLVQAVMFIAKTYESGVSILLLAVRETNRESGQFARANPNEFPCAFRDSMGCFEWLLSSRGNM
jgi:hypothetical protein